MRRPSETITFSPTDWVKAVEAKKEKEMTEMPAIERYVEKLNQCVCGDYIYYISHYNSITASLTELHGGAREAQELISKVAIPFYAQDYRDERVPLIDMAYKCHVRLRQAIESYREEEGRPYTAVRRTTQGLFLPYGATVQTFRATLGGLYNRRVFTSYAPGEIALTVNVTNQGFSSPFETNLYKCGICDKWHDARPSIFGTVTEEKDGEWVKKTACLDCALSLWQAKGKFLVCHTCNSHTCHCDAEIDEGYGYPLCPLCSPHYFICDGCGYVVGNGNNCNNCRERRVREYEVQTKYIPSRCKWEKEFSLLLPDGTIRCSDTFLSITRSQGEVSNEGIDEIAQTLRSAGHRINFTSESRKEGESGLSCDVTQDISFVHGKGFPAIAKKIESFYYRHGQDKPSKETLQRIGEIAAQYTPKEDKTLSYTLTRDFDHSRDFYCHPDSCWWSQKPTAFCFLKRYGGFMVAGRESEDMSEDEYCASRGVAFPLYKIGGELSGERLALAENPTDGLPWNPAAYFLFNVYGLDGYISLSNALQQRVGMDAHERINIDPLNGELWINGRISYQGELTSSFGYLIYPKEMELPPSKIEGSKYRHLSLAPKGMRRLERSCHCG
jgi:hypothetical protein